MPLDGGKSKAYGSGVNMAPLKPLLALQKHGPPEKHYLNDFAKEVYDDLIIQDIDPWRETLEMGRMISNLRAGKLMLKRDPVFHELILMQPPKKKNNRRGIPVFQFYSSNLQATWCNSNPDIDPVIEGDDDRSDLQVETLKQVHNFYSSKIFNEKYNENEALSAQDWGTYITRIGYNETLRRVKMLKPVVENVTQTLYEGYGACVSCGHEDTDAAFEEMQMKEGALEPMCPKCGAVGAIIDPSLTLDADMVTRYEEYEVGDLQGDLLHFPASRFNIRKTAEESEYFIYEQMMPIRLLKSMLGDVEIAEEHPSGEQNYGLLILEALATRGGTVEDLGKDRLYGHYNTFKQQCLLTEMWIKPELYADVHIQGDDKTVSGQKLEKGKTLGEVFPHGMCFVGINGMETILAIYGECHSESIRSGIYHLQSHSGVGKGVADAVDIYKDMNLLHTKAMAYIERFATPSYGYVKDSLTEEMAAKIGDPTQNIPFDISMFPNIRSIADLVQPLMSGSPNQSLFLYGQQLNNWLQLAFQTTEFSDGLPGVKNTTATGAEITRDNARKQSVPALKLKAEHRKDLAPVILEKFKQIPAARWFEKADRFGVVKGSYISGDDLPARVSWEVVGNSEMPLNEYDERANIAELGMQVGGLPGLVQLAQMAPRFAGWIAKKYKVDAPIVTEDEIAKVCRGRVDNITALCREADQLLSMASQILGTQPDTRPVVDEVLAKLNRPLSVTEPAHAEKAAWLAELLDADELHEDGGILLRECVQQLVKNHMKMTIMQPYELMKLEQEVQLALQEQAAEAMMPQIQAQANMAAESEAQSAGLAERGAQNQHQRQMEATMAQEGVGLARDEMKHGQNMELAAANAAASKDQALAVAKAKPAPAPK